MSRRRILASLALLMLSSCGSAPVEPTPRPEASPRAERAAPAASTEAPASADLAEAPSPPEAPSVLRPFPADDQTQARLLRIHADAGRWHAYFLEWNSHEGSQTLTARPLDDLARVTERFDVPVHPRLVLDLRIDDGRPLLVYQSQPSADTAIYARSLSPDGTETVLVPAFGDLELERGEALRAFDFDASTTPPRGLHAWVGITREARPAREMAAARRRYEEDTRRFPDQLIEPPPTHRTVDHWRRFGVVGRRGLEAHPVQRWRGRDDRAKLISGVAASALYHAGIFTHERSDRRRGLDVWFFDAQTGRRTDVYAEDDGDPHGFSLRAAVVDREGRLWLAGAANVGDGGDRHWVWVFDPQHALLSRRRLPHAGTWQGPASFVQCGGAMWLAAAAVEEPARTERLHLYRLDPEADPEPGAVLFEGHAPHGPGDAVWHTHSLSTACHEGEGAVAFRFAGRHEQGAERPVGFIRFQTGTDG